MVLVALAKKQYLLQCWQCPPEQACDAWPDAWCAVTGLIKLALQAGKANPAPPVGPALGAKVRLYAVQQPHAQRAAELPWQHSRGQGGPCTASNSGSQWPTSASAFMHLCFPRLWCKTVSRSKIYCLLAGQSLTQCWVDLEIAMSLPSSSCLFLSMKRSISLQPRNQEVRGSRLGS